MKPDHHTYPIVSALLASMLVAACGGGASDPTPTESPAAGTGTASTALEDDAWRRKTAYNASTTTSTTTTAQPSVTAAPIVLSNLPTETTTQTSASIGHTGDPSYTVYCRRDTYAPVPCPNPFVLGASQPLAGGKHTVDFYMYTGAALDAAKPDASYSWTITASTTETASSTTTTTTGTTSQTSTSTAQTSSSTTGSTATTSTTSSTSTSTATSGTSGGSVAPVAGALAAAPTPASTAVSGYSGQWNGTTISTSGAYMGRVADPSGSGRTVNLHRVTQGGASIWGGVRSEQLWNNHDSTDLVPGKDIWMSFAVQRKSDETFPASSSYDQHLVFQTHTPQSGDTQPDIALFATGNGGGTMRWRVAYNTSGNVDGQGWMSTEGNPWVSEADPIAPGQWHRYVVHYRPGYASSHNPLLRVWRAKPGGAYEQIVNHTGYNTYNTSRTGAGPSYPRIGLYKWTSSTWTSNSVAWYLTPLYFGTGADMLEAGKAALSGL